MKVKQQLTTNTLQMLANQSFKGIPVAKIRLKSLPTCDELLICKVNKEDTNFLKEMLKKLDISKFYTQIKDTNGFEEWKGIINGAIENIEFGSIGYIAIKNKKPCAIISNNKVLSQGKYYVDHVASWPTQVDKGTQGSGKVIFKQILEDAVQDKARQIMLTAAELKPRGKSSKDFYRELGFIENVKNYTEEINGNENIKKICSKLDEIMDYERIDKSEPVALNTLIDIS